VGRPRRVQGQVEEEVWRRTRLAISKSPPLEPRSGRSVDLSAGWQSLPSRSLLPSSCARWLASDGRSACLWCPLPTRPGRACASRPNAGRFVTATTRESRSSSPRWPVPVSSASSWPADPGREALTRSRRRSRQRTSCRRPVAAPPGRRRVTNKMALRDGDLEKGEAYGARDALRLIDALVRGLDRLSPPLT
jgi:hypothetical protein